MNRRRVCVLIGAFVLFSYPIAYFVLGQRDQGRARGAGEYFHYRDFAASWEVYVFSPIAFAEAQLIQMSPKSFLTNPSWAETSQRLVIRVPGNSTMFWFPPFKQAEPTK